MAYQGIFVDGRWPDWSQLWTRVAIAVVALPCGAAASSAGARARWWTSSDGQYSRRACCKAYKQYSTRCPGFGSGYCPSAVRGIRLPGCCADVSFHVEPGEAAGVIGINAPGRAPCSNHHRHDDADNRRVELGGSVAAMLELGMGFHPEFTGRQNVMMAGQLLGLSVEEIGRLMPEIEAFAEIGEYIDQPVRVYSSGMQMRLAFSVATARRPDILIVDEALSVGDAYFQHKSFERIREFRKGGTTLLLVSHDKQAIQSICDRALLLDGDG